MRLLSKTILVCVLLLVSLNPASGAEYAPFGIQQQSKSLDEYYDSLGAPDIYCEAFMSSCLDTIKNGQGRILREFGSDTIVSSVIASGRFEDTAYLVVKTIYDDDDSSYDKVFLFDHTGDHREIYLPWELGTTLDVHVTPGPNFLTLHKNGLKRWNVSGESLAFQESPTRLQSGDIQTDLAGDYSAIGLSEEDEVWLSNGPDWENTGLVLPRRGDRDDILTSYPLPDGDVVGAVYVYENVFRKGLHMVRTYSDGRQPTYTPVFLSNVRNVGWDPRIYVTEKIYHLGSKDSTNDQRVYLTVPRGELREDTVPGPDEELFPRGEDQLSFLAGTGGMVRNWEATSTVRDGGELYTSVFYNFASANLTEAKFQGRVDETRFVLSYLKQLARDRVEAAGGRAAKEGVEYLLGMVEFEDYFAPSSGLRLKFRRSRTEGLATISRRDQPDTTRTFSVKYSQYGLYNTRERGEYFGLEYTDYRLPSAVGFSDNNKDIVYSDFDPNFGIRKLSLVGGYDPQSYARRYETNYSDWFFSWELGLGAGHGDLSNPVKEDAKNETSKDDITLPLFFAYDGTLETGWIWQGRSMLLNGLGFQTLFGYRANGTYMYAERDEKSESEDTLQLEFERVDIWHGPYFGVNVIF